MKKRVFVKNFLLTYPSIVRATGHIFGTILTHNGSNGVFSQTIGAFLGSRW